MAAPRIALQRTLMRSSRLPLRQPPGFARLSSSKALSHDAIEELLSKPSWSVKALQSASPDPQTPAITTKQLHRLLRLSALPLPQSAEEEAGMIRTLEAQLHFVRAIQGVDTAGVEPLAAIRDETCAADSENEITADTLKDEFAKEKQVGFARRIVREHEEDPRDAEHSDPLAQAPRKIGHYIVVNTKED